MSEQKKPVYVTPRKFGKAAKYMPSEIDRVWTIVNTLCTEYSDTYTDEHGGPWRVYRYKDDGGQASFAEKVAAEAGMRYNTASYLLSRFQDLGVIRKGRRACVVIFDHTHPVWQRLEEEAKAMQARLGRDYGLRSEREREKIQWPGWDRNVPHVGEKPSGQTSPTSGKKCQANFPHVGEESSPTSGTPLSTYSEVSPKVPPPSSELVGFFPEVAHPQEGEGGGRGSLPPPVPEYDLDQLGRAFLAVWWGVPRETRFIACKTWPDDLKRFCKARELPFELFLALDGRYRHLGDPPNGPEDLEAEWFR